MATWQACPYATPMVEIFTNINNFLNSPQTIKVLYTLVLIMALAWLLSGGFSFLNKPKGKDENKHKDKNKNKRDQ